MNSFLKYLATIVCCLCVFFIFLYNRLSCKKRTSATTRVSPEPGGAWPLIGHLHKFAGPEPPHAMLGSMADRYGPIFTIRLGLRKAIVVSSWEVAKECFTTHDKTFSSRPTSTASRIMGYNYAMFGLAPYGQYWRQMRRITVHELLSSRQLELVKHVQISELNTSMRYLYQLLPRNCNDEEGPVLTNMQAWFNDLVLNIFVRIVAGKIYSGAATEVDKDEAKQLRKAVADFGYLLFMFVLSDALPFLGWLDYQGHEKAMKKVAKEVDTILEKWLQEHKQKKLERKTETHQDFMDLLLSVLDSKEFPHHEVDTVNKATCLSMILAGTDTTVVTLTWVLSLLLNNRETLDKAQNEIDIQVGKDKIVEESDIVNLVYLQAVVKETLRLYPVAPLSLPHEAIEDCIVSGYNVPKGTHLLVNLWKIQRDPRVWANPSEFLPERFLTAEATFDLRGQYSQLMPFGSGRRSCPGISLALQLVHLTLARLLQGFKFETQSNAQVDMTESAGLSLARTTPLLVLTTPRLPPHLY